MEVLQMSSEHIVKNVSDRLNAKDGMHTLIMAGHDLHVDKNGIHYLGEEVIERQHNKVTTGGAIRMLQLMFGATCDLEVTSLNTLMNIGLDGKIDDVEKEDIVKKIEPLMEKLIELI